MLVRFNVGNFLSFQEIQEISLLEGKAHGKEQRLYQGDGLRLLKFAAVFGANAAGKSNLTRSMQFVQNTVSTGFLEQDGISSFRMAAEYESKPSYFEFELMLGGKSYSYGFEALLWKGEFLSEWLVALGEEGETILFSRDAQKGTFETDLQLEDPALSARFAVYAEDIRALPGQLFLTEMNRGKAALYQNPGALSVFQDAFLWLTKRLDINYPDRPVSDYSYFQNHNRKEEIRRCIAALGTGITDYELEDASLEQMRKELPSEVYDKAMAKIRAMGRGTGLEGIADESAAYHSFSVRSGDVYFLVEPEAAGVHVKTLLFRHGEASFHLWEESDGTKRILDLLDLLFGEEGQIYVVDEIDRSLHPGLTRKFIEEYLSLAKERNVQLLITTHESRLLDFHLLRQDEIWIANKNSNGDTELYSLDEYNVRFDTQIDHAYLEGRYGGVPVFDELFAPHNPKGGEQ